MVPKLGQKGRKRVRLEAPPPQSLVDAGLTQAAHGIHKVFHMSRSLGKGTVNLMAGKHVYLDQILGKWRLMQDVDLGVGAIVSCPATIELLDGGVCLSYFEDQECVTKFTFRERAWPKYCTISFEAEAFQGPNDDSPVRMQYRGKFKKSIMNPNIIFIRGRMYRVTRNVFGAKKRVKCGKFKMTQLRARPVLAPKAKNSRRKNKNKNKNKKSEAKGRVKTTVVRKNGTKRLKSKRSRR